MQTLQFSIDINAPAARVWDILWSADTYGEWTSYFNPDNSFGAIQSDWQTGGKTLFLDGSGKNGMVSTIKSMDKPYQITFAHVGTLENGVEDTSSEEVKTWAGTLEEYRLSENEGRTTLYASVQTQEQWANNLSQGFDRGLKKVKELAEA